MSEHHDSVRKRQRASKQVHTNLPKWPAKVLPEDYWAELVALQHRWNEKRWPLLLIQVMTIRCVIECWWGLNRIEAENRWSRINEQSKIFRPNAWIESIPIRNKQSAYRILSLIPSKATVSPFERDLKLFGRVVAHIPPLHKLNPLYESLVMLRFKALCYLVDECGEDPSSLK